MVNRPDPVQPSDRPSGSEPMLPDAPQGDPLRGPSPAFDRQGLPTAAFWAQLGWLLLPEERAVEIWRKGQEGMAERVDNANRLDGRELAEGLGLELAEIWAV